MIAADFLELLRCPQTLQPLSLAGPETLAAINARISSGQVNGTVDVLPAALVRADGAILYPVCEGIPVLLAENAITL